MIKITINSELDLYEKGGNSTHARWIADKFLKARQLGIISEVELAILDTSLADDFGSFKAYQEGAASVDVLSSVEQAKEYLSMTALHIDDKAVGAGHLIHYIEMAGQKLVKALNVACPEKHSLEPMADVSKESTRDRCRREMKDVRGDHLGDQSVSHQSW